MRWTREFPTCPGFYWFREGREGSEFEEGEVVKVIAAFDKFYAPVGHNGGMRPFFQIQSWSWPVEWSDGPIDKPEPYVEPELYEVDLNLLEFERNLFGVKEG